MIRMGESDALRDKKKSISVFTQTSEELVMAIKESVYLIILKLASYTVGVTFQK
jgi:hypothetical protein